MELIDIIFDFLLKQRIIVGIILIPIGLYLIKLNLISIIKGPIPHTEMEGVRETRDYFNRGMGMLLIAIGILLINIWENNILMLLLIFIGFIAVIFLLFPKRIIEWRKWE